MKYSISILVLGVLTASATPQAAEAKKVPFILMPTGHFLVHVKVNDKGPYNLIFDTGAPTMLVNNKLAKDAGLVFKKNAKGVFNPMPAMTAKTFEIGPLKADNVTMMVFDHPTVRAFSDAFEKEHGSIDGIVGFPFFARYKMVVDYQAKELLMTPNGYEPGDVLEKLMATMLGGPKNQGKPRVAAPAAQWGLSVEKDAKDEEAGVTIKTVMPNSAAEKAGLKPGDRLLTLDGRWTDSITDTYNAASFAKPGKSAPVVIKRDGKEMKLTVTPANGL